MKLFNWFIPKPLRLGISFSGGGVKGTTYIGVIRALEEVGIKAAVVAGLSAGSIVAAGYANGLNSGQMEQIAEQLRLWDVINKNPLRSQSMISTSELAEFLQSFIKKTDFSYYHDPRLIVFATDFDKKVLEVLDTGDVVSAVVASCGLPPIISPSIRNGKRLGEGGFTIQYGAKYLRRAGADVVLGLEVSNLQSMKFPGLSELFEGVSATIKLIGEQEKQLDPVDIEIPELSVDGSIIDFGKIGDELIEHGYSKTMTMIPKLKQLLHID